MAHKTRLGPIAVFLTVVTMVLTTLAVLTVATSNADRIMAGRFASVTQTRYELEADGEEFLSRAAEAAGAADMEGVTVTADGIAFEEEKDGYRLEVEISTPDAQGNFEINKWKLSKLWNSDDPMQNIWPGF